jgi:hypothetical protein
MKKLAAILCLLVAGSAYGGNHDTIELSAVSASSNSVVASLTNEYRVTGLVKGFRFIQETANISSQTVTVYAVRSGQQRTLGTSGGVTFGVPWAYQVGTTPAQVGVLDEQLYYTVTTGATATGGAGRVTGIVLYEK